MLTVSKSDHWHVRIALSQRSLSLSPFLFAEDHHKICVILTSACYDVSLSQDITLPIVLKHASEGRNVANR